MITDFKQLTTSKEINWTPCFENFTCTRLEVPLDYENPDVGTAGIAFLRLAAEGGESAKDILINPGEKVASGRNYKSED